MASETGVSMPPKIAATFSLEDELARGDQALGRAEFVVALDELELAPAEQAALGVDLVDREHESARDGFAGLRRSARQRRHMADLDRVGGEGRRQGKSRHGSGRKYRAPRYVSG